MNLASRFASGRRGLLALAAALCSLPASAVHDYGLGAYPSLAAWQGAAARAAFSAPEPMDYGLGSFATLAQYHAAGLPPATVAAR
jgi:hypothetical protein